MGVATSDIFLICCDIKITWHTTAQATATQLRDRCVDRDSQNLRARTLLFCLVSLQNYHRGPVAYPKHRYFMTEFRAKAHLFEVQEKIIGSRRICYDLTKITAWSSQTLDNVQLTENSVMQRNITQT